MLNSNSRKKIAFITTLVLVASSTSGLSNILASNLNSFDVNAVSNMADSISIIESSGYSEGAYVEWTGSTDCDYNIYYKSSGGEYLKIDSMLIRQYSTNFRADVVGLSAGSYTLKVVPVVDGVEGSAVETSALTVSSYDRSGFAFSEQSPNGNSGIGAYNSDGTLKANAKVLYVTEDTKNTITMDIAGATYTGIGNILQKANKADVPICVRIIGKVTIDGITNSNDSKNISCKEASNITFEGIGEDATCYGFGVRILKSSSIEVRNLGIMLFTDDGIALESDNSNIWVHNNDIFYGTAGGDADQAKGDGSMDLKNDSQYITISYNHFWDSGKMSLCGMKSETGENWITYHHNWFDHSDSRHPRVRTMSVHVYNNYYDGNSKYGVGVTMGANAFVESNYFRNCQYPMLSSLQGTDADGEGTFSGENGGVIKSYGNIMVGQKSYITQNDTSDTSDIDAYEVTNKSDAVPSSVTALVGGTIYNNFDTSDTMYSYTTDSAEDVPKIVMSSAGRLNGGDFTWEFDDSVDDEDYSINTELMAKINSYTSSIVSIGSTNPDTPIVPEETTTTTSNSETSVTTVTSSEETFATTTVVTDNPSIALDAIYCSPNGDGDGSSIDNPTNVLDAIKTVKAGGVIYLLDGTYSFSETINIEEDNSGDASAYKTIMAYPNANVVWDFSSLSVSDSNRGVVLQGDYWHFKGFEITKAGDNGMLLAGSHNVIEMMVFNNNQDTGLQISRYNSSYSNIADWPSYNIILNCTSKNNCDDATMENADGFAAKLTCGEGNVFDGCMAYNNSDDGWDLYAKTETGPIGVVTIQNCIAFRNGYTEDGRGYGDCDGNGFKLGGAGVGTAHVVKNCLAFENLNCGFTDNNNPKLESLTDCTAFNNNFGGNGKPNFSLYRCTDDGCDFTNIISYNNDKATALANDKFVGTMTNSIFYNGAKYYNVKGNIAIDNGDKVGDIVTLSDSNFVSVEAPAMGQDFHTLWRTSDNSIDVHGFMELLEDSNYSNMGADFSNYESINPDLPEIPTEEVTTSPEDTEVTTTSISNTENPDVTTIPSETSIDIEVDTTTSTPSEAHLLGDVNNDGAVKSNDLLLLKKYLLGITEVTEPQGLLNSDVTQDGNVKSNDLLLLKKHLLGLVELN